MIPILFEHDEKLFESHGLGDLIACTECKAKQTAEGEIEMSFTYPPNDDLSLELQIGRQVLAKIDDEKRPQIFRIYGVEADITGRLTVNCQHISYDLSGYPVKNFDEQISPHTVINNGVLKKEGGKYKNLVLIGTDTEFPFHISAYDIPAYSGGKTYALGEYVVYQSETYQCVEAVTSPEATFNATKWNLIEKFKMETPKTVREVLLDGDESILGLYGGDIVFDNYSIEVKKIAGEDRGVVIEYGVDLTDFNQDKNISEMVTGVLPYWKGNIRGSTGSATRYEVYTGDRFEDGYTYYTRVPNYTLTTDTTCDISKTYYVLDGTIYRPIEMRDLDFKSGTTYYESSDYYYTPSSVLIPSPEESYYILENDKYRKYNIGDLTFKNDTNYYELIDGVYQLTGDSDYNPSKVYYIQKVEVGKVSQYDEVTTAQLTFKKDVTYLEEIDGELVPTQDDRYDPSKEYYIEYNTYDYITAWNNNGYIFKSPPSGAVLCEYDYNRGIFVPTSDEYYNSSKNYYYCHYDSVYKRYDYDHDFSPATDVDFRPDYTYALAVGNNPDGTIIYDDVTGSYDSTYCWTYYIKFSILHRDPVTNSDLDFVDSLKPYFEKKSMMEATAEDEYVQTTDAHYDWTKTYYLPRRGDAPEIFLKVEYYDLEFKPDLLIYERTIAAYLPTADRNYNPEKIYYIPSKTFGSYTPIGISDLDFKSGTYYFVENGYIYSSAQPPFDPTKVYYVSETTEDNVKYKYADRILYADGFENKPASLQKIVALDLSEYFIAETENQIPQSDELIKRAKRWMLTNEIGIPAIDLTVSYAMLGQDVRLFDAVTVRFPKLDIETKAKVTSFTYDVLKEHCIEIEVTNAKAANAWAGLEDASRLRKGTLTPSRIGKKSITSEHIGTAEIGSSNIASGGVAAVNIKPEAVTNSKIADDAITYNKIVDGAIINSKIKDGAIDTPKVLEQAITLKKLDKTLQIFYADIVAALTIFSDYVKVNTALECSWLYVRSARITMGAVGNSAVYGPISNTLNIPTSVTEGGYVLKADSPFLSWHDVIGGQYSTENYVIRCAIKPSLKTTPHYLNYIGKLNQDQ